MIATPEQTSALRSQYDICPENWAETAANERVTLWCFDFGLLSLLKIAAKNSLANYRLRTDVPTAGQQVTREIQWQTYLTDEDRRTSFMWNVTWPHYYPPMDETGYQELVATGTDSTLELLLHAANHYVPGIVRVNQDTEKLYGWLQNVPLTQKLTGLPGNTASQFTGNFLMLCHQEMNKLRR